MFTLVITEKGGAQKRMDFDKSEITIGRVQGNDVILPKGNVSKRHSRIVLKDSRFIVVDLKSTNGTYVNGRKITSPLVVKSGDKIYIGDFILTLEEAAGAGAGMPSAPPPEPAAPSPPSFRSGTAPPRQVAEPAPALPPPMMGGGMNGPPGMPPPLGGPMGPPPGPPSVVASPPPMPGPPMGGPVGMPSPPMGGPAMGGPGMGGPGMAPPPPMGGPVMAPPPPMGGPALAPPPPMGGPPPLAGAPMGGPGAAPPPLGGGRRSTAAPVPGPPPGRPAQDRFPLEEEPSEEYSAAGGAAAAGPSPVRAVPAPSAVGRASAAAAAPMAPPARGPARPSGAPQPSSGPLARGPAAVPPLRPVAAAAPPAPRAAPAPASSPNVLRAVMERVAQGIDVRSLDVAQLRDEGHWERTERSIGQVVDRLASEGALPGGTDRQGLVRDALQETLGLGALEDLLADDAISEIHVNGTEPLVAERNGRTETTERAFSSEEAVVTAVRRMLAPLGRDLTGPLVEARLADGTSLVAMLAPVAVRGAFVSLRRARRASSTLPQLVETGAMSQGIADFLAACLAARRNILVVGSSGSDAAPVLGGLCQATEAHERVVLVEPAPEIAAPPHVVTLEPSVGDDGASAVSMRQLLGAALRARADRLVVSDLRGAETRDALEAAAAREGAAFSVGAAGPHEGLARLESCALLASDAPVAAMRGLVATAVHVIVTVTRHVDGVRRVTGVHHLTGATEAGYSVAEVFVYEGGGPDGQGGVMGRWAPTGYVPPFVEQLRAAGVAASNSMFRE